MKKFFTIMTIIGLLAFGSIAFVGCQGGSYISPSSSMPSHKNYIEVDIPKDIVWDSLLQCMGQKFFVVNNIEKDSGFINLSYSADPPSLIVDCGHIKCMANGEVYNLAERYQIGQVERWKPKLEGRVNILVTEINPHKSRIMANVKYIFQGSYYKAFQSAYSPGINYTETMNFNSTEVGDMVGPPGVYMTCIPNSSLEEMILDCIDYRPGDRVELPMQYQKEIPITPVYKKKATSLKSCNGMSPCPYLEGTSQYNVECKAGSSQQRFCP